MLRFDRYLVAHSRALDLTSGNPVDVEHARRTTRAPAPLFTSRAGRTLIDVEPAGAGRIEIWESWVPRHVPRTLGDTLTSFTELLDCARLGAPRAFDLAARRADREYLRRALAREARVRGWIPIAAELLGVVTKPSGLSWLNKDWIPERGARTPPHGAQNAPWGPRRARRDDREYREYLRKEQRSQPGCPARKPVLDQPRQATRSRHWPAWLHDRSLVIFVEAPGVSGDAVLALLRLAQRDARPHVLVRSLAHDDGRPAFFPVRAHTPQVHEEVSRFGEETQAKHTEATISVESAARWALMLEELAGGAEHAVRTVDLAQVLVAREQTFEARALLARIDAADPAVAPRHAALGQQIAERAATRTQAWELVDDFVGMLQICQDVEDEQTALARVGAYLRERLQASTVAFIARETSGPRVLTRVGSESARVDLAVRSIETGVPIPASQHEGPVESACPVRHATEVIGAVWCRWSAGTPVATETASRLLGIAAAATAPNVRLAIARREIASPDSNPLPDLVGESAAMIRVREAILRAAASPFPVVIEGESGSGKELAARAIHARGARSGKRFCAINCAALVDDLVEAELFGHTRGAFTGANTERTGLFEDANGGTLFLDEAAELGARVQAKLLRTLQEGEVRRLGESTLRRVDVRVVAATNRPLATEVEAGRFRKDLWYRLDVIRVALPPLRSRLEDLPLLAAHIWRMLASRTNSKALLSPAAIAALGAYDWPGNVRELQNVLASLLVSAPPAGLIGPSALPEHIARVAAFDRAVTLDAARRQFEERYVRAALARAGGRTTVAAKELGLTRQGLVKLMSRLKIEVPKVPRVPEVP